MGGGGDENRVTDGYIYIYIHQDEDEEMSLPPFKSVSQDSSCFGVGGADWQIVQMVCMYECMNECMCKHVYICVCVCMGIYICVCVCMGIYIYIYICMHVCMYIYIYICMHILNKECRAHKCSLNFLFLSSCCSPQSHAHALAWVVGRVESRDEKIWQ